MGGWQRAATEIYGQLSREGATIIARIRAGTQRDLQDSLDKERPAGQSQSVPTVATISKLAESHTSLRQDHLPANLNFLSPGIRHPNGLHPGRPEHELHNTLLAAPLAHQCDLCAGVAAAT